MSFTYDEDGGAYERDLAQRAEQAWRIGSSAEAEHEAGTWADTHIHAPGPIHTTCPGCRDRIDTTRKAEA